MVQVFAIVILLICASAVKLPEFSMEEMMSYFADLDDTASIHLTNSNFIEKISSSSDPWFIFFAEPRSQNSIIKNPVWFIFAERAQENNLPLNIGKVDMSTEDKVRSKFRVYTFPTFLYIDNGYVYNYTGPAEEDNFVAVFEKKTYLQYDRKKLELEDKEKCLCLQFKELFVRKPAEVMGGLFFSSLIASVVSLPSGCFRKYGVLCLIKRGRLRKNNS
ncbi:hypothetical protein SteCoe_23692 [Stentor coeruleus]|uniref:Thioredoxin domain-containing protein n=1 Tax=Stentor coeruleus TaxID=5963 RepID=A0A1R2BJQ8_9CILI|nr:hypothetical protein SteCoe_23692 [Stentor coeruleus]